MCASVQGKMTQAAQKSDSCVRLFQLSSPTAAFPRFFFYKSLREAFYEMWATLQCSFTFASVCCASSPNKLQMSKNLHQTTVTAPCDAIVQNLKHTMFMINNCYTMISLATMLSSHWSLFNKRKILPIHHSPELTSVGCCVCASSQKSVISKNNQTQKNQM